MLIQLTSLRFYPKAKLRDNQKQVSYAKRLTRELSIVYLTYTTQRMHGFEHIASRRNLFFAVVQKVWVMSLFKPHVLTNHIHIIMSMSA